MIAIVFAVYLLLIVLKLDGHVSMSWLAMLVCPWVVLILVSVALNIPSSFSWWRNRRTSTVSVPVELFYIPEKDWKGDDTSYYQSLDGRHVVRRNDVTDEWEYIRDFQTVTSRDSLEEVLESIPARRAVVC